MSEVAQSCPTFYDPMNCSLPGFRVHGILQAEILEWVAIPSSRESSRPRDRTRVSCRQIVLHLSQQGSPLPVWWERKPQHTEAEQSSKECGQNLCQVFYIISFNSTVSLRYTLLFRLRAREVHYLIQGLPRWLSGKESTCQCRRHGFSPWVGKIPWRRNWQPTPVFLPVKSYGHRNLVG